MIKIYEPYYSKEALRAEPEALFIFGDNCECYGRGGQAVIRYEPNAVGIATKLSPRAFMSDDDLLANCARILKDLEPINSALNQGKTVYWPKGGIGTGLSAMPSRCPQTFEVLKFFMDFIFYKHAEKDIVPTWQE
tara:strand:- start:1353 stop:1757 length:405 start_codon:yes stop_codon:yes gene_type:complete